MTLVLSIIHVLACVLIIGVILLQSGKGGGLGAGFGGASSAATQIFGGRGAGNFLSRSTVALAVVFFLTSLSLAWISSRPNSLLDLTETSGAEAGDADTIVEKGSGPLVPLDEDGQPLEEGAEVDPSAIEPTGAADDAATGATDGSTEVQKLDLSDLMKKTQQAGDEGATDAAEEAADEPKAEEKPAPKAEEKPEPKAEGEPEAKPEPKAEEKPEAKPEPKAEEKPKPKAEEKPEPEASDEADAPEDSAAEEAPSE